MVTSKKSNKLRIVKMKFIVEINWFERIFKIHHNSLLIFTILRCAIYDKNQINWDLRIH